MLLFLGRYFVLLQKRVDPTNVAILRGVPRNTRTTCLLCEENIVNATFAFSSPNTDYQLLDSEGSGIGHNYSFWASRCAGMTFIFLLGMLFIFFIGYLSQGLSGSGCSKDQENYD